ncbi:hypothetical protein I79_011252 [Cricetulus griseus]|uniref:Uncharacterized protein n=1 Tax=Cricetulus griseus TaxID=10029 RepID=G3HKM3_CRIGR|nr:hypothetical protein I79_011252 [Cricetulus griseus]
MTLEAAGSGDCRLLGAASCDNEQTSRNLTQEAISRREISSFLLGKQVFRVLDSNICDLSHRTRFMIPAQLYLNKITSNDSNVQPAFCHCVGPSSYEH